MFSFAIRNGKSSCCSVIALSRLGFAQPLQSVESVYQRNLGTQVTQSEMASTVQDKFKVPVRMDTGKSVWVEYIDMALKYKPVNLGQGFPDYPIPDYIYKALSDVAVGPNFILHQYTRGFGHPRLINALAKIYGTVINREINPQTEILVTCGAYQALYNSIVGLVDQGDEAIIIEPFYDCYAPMVHMAGGTPRFISLKCKNVSGNEMHAGDFKLDFNELEKLINSKTKVLILNNPNNPLGKIYNKEELETISKLCIKHNLVCISDEVYEWMDYDTDKHIRICTLPGMWERTVTIGSAGKTLNVTGWKIGWAYGPDYLIKNLQLVHQNVVYTCPTPLQEAIAIVLEMELPRFQTKEGYFHRNGIELKVKRDKMVADLKLAGFIPIVPQGGYFMLADYKNLVSKADMSQESDPWADYRFTKWMIKNIGVQAIPNSAFYGSDHKKDGENYIRFSFFKNDKLIGQAMDILRTWNSKRC